MYLWVCVCICVCVWMHICTACVEVRGHWELVFSCVGSKDLIQVFRLGDTEPHHWPLNVVHFIIVCVNLCMVCKQVQAHTCHAEHV